MNKFKIILGAAALAMAAVVIVACSKEKTAQQEMSFEQQPKNPNDYTLAEMAEAMSWEEGKAFFENQPIKDYTYVCEKVLNGCESDAKEVGLPYVISWILRMPNYNCNPDFPGTCFAIRKKENSSLEANAMGYFEDGKLLIVPITEENGFTADGYLVVGVPIEIENDNIIIQDGIYTAYYNEEIGMYSAVAVDYYSMN